MNFYFISSLFPEEDSQNNEAEHIDNNLTEDVRTLRDNERASTRRASDIIVARSMWRHDYLEFKLDSRFSSDLIWTTMHKHEELDYMNI